MKKEIPKFLAGLKIKKEIELDLNSILLTALQKYTAKDLLEYMFFIISFESIQYITTIAALLANKKDVESVETMILLRYVLDNWDKKDFKDKATENFKKFMKKVDGRAK